MTTLHCTETDRLLRTGEAIFVAIKAGGSHMFPLSKETINAIPTGSRFANEGGGAIDIYKATSSASGKGGAVGATPYSIRGLNRGEFLFSVGSSAGSDHLPKVSRSA